MDDKEAIIILGELEDRLKYDKRYVEAVKRGRDALIQHQENISKSIPIDKYSDRK